MNDIQRHSCVQAELLFADPGNIAQYDTAAGLQDFTSSGSDPQSWLDDALVVGNANANTSQCATSDDGHAAMCM